VQVRPVLTRLGGSEIKNLNVAVLKAVLNQAPVVAHAVDQRQVKYIPRRTQYREVMMRQVRDVVQATRTKGLSAQLGFQRTTEERKRMRSGSHECIGRIVMEDED